MRVASLVIPAVNRFGGSRRTVAAAVGEIEQLGGPERYVEQRCDAGQSIRFLTFAGEDHVSIVAPASPLGSDLVSWTEDRLAGTPAETGCETIAG